MEPRIQYVTTRDGVRIAYALTGRGPPVVLVKQPLASHLQLEWQQQPLRTFYEAIASWATLVRFDARGVGLSDRDVDDLSLDGHVLDLEAVVDKLGPQPFVLWATEHGGVTAIAYAAKHPERVARFILTDCFPRPREIWSMPRALAFRRLMIDDWEMWSENVGALAFGYGREEARNYSRLVRACMTPESVERFFEGFDRIDVTELLAEIKAPTLVVHHSALQWLPAGQVRELATRIPDAQLVELEGQHLDDVERYREAIEDFLGLGSRGAPGPVEPAPAEIHTILFTDVEGSTALTQRLGDAKAREVLREHEHIVREALKAHGGSEVKAMGDGFMACFSSATRALECAIAMQREIDAWNTARPEPVEGRAEQIKVRIGLNAGEPIAEEDDLFGTAVNLAARIAAQAEGGEILVANVVRELAAGKGFLFADRGEFAVRGFEDPVRLYEVRWGEEG